MKIVIFFSIILISLVGLATALQVGIITSTDNAGVNIIPPKVPINYSEVEVNDSLLWDGNAWSDTRWLNIDGSNANQDIDVDNNNITTSAKFIVDNAVGELVKMETITSGGLPSGSFSWLGGSRLSEQRAGGGGVNRMVYTPNGDRLDILAGGGSSYASNIYGGDFFHNGDGTSYRSLYGVNGKANIYYSGALVIDDFTTQSINFADNDLTTTGDINLPNDFSIARDGTMDARFGIDNDGTPDLDEIYIGGVDDGGGDVYYDVASIFLYGKTIQLGDGATTDGQVNVNGDLLVDNDLTLDGTTMTWAGASSKLLDSSSAPMEIRIHDDQSSPPAYLISTIGSEDYIAINTKIGFENISFGSTVVSPAYNFLGTGTTTFSGDVDVSGDLIVNNSAQLGDSASYLDSDIHGINTPPVANQMLTSASYSDFTTTGSAIGYSNTFTDSANIGASQTKSDYGFKNTLDISGSQTTASQQRHVWANHNTITDSSTYNDGSEFSLSSFTGTHNIVDFDGTITTYEEYYQYGTRNQLFGDIGDASFTKKYGTYNVVTGTAGSSYAGWFRASGATNNWALWNDAGNVFLGDDDEKTYWGTSKDKSIKANNTAMYFSTEVGGTPFIFDNDIKVKDLNMSEGFAHIYIEDDSFVQAFRILEGTGNDYLSIWTGNGFERIDFGDTAINPDYSFLGSGETTFVGNVQMNSDLNVSGNFTAEEGYIKNKVYYDTAFNESISTTQGNIANINTCLDDMMFNVTENSGIGAMDINFTFTSVESFNNIVLCHKYTGNHDLHFAVWNNDLNKFIYLNDIGGTDVQNCNLKSVGGNDDALINSGEVKIRIEHPQNGIASHLEMIDCLRLER